MAGAPDSVALLLFFVFWYAGNMKYNEYNTASLNAVGGKTAGMTMTVATLQLGVCSIYALIMWVVKINPVKLFGLQLPTKQNVPKTTQGDLAKTVPVGFCSAAAHACTVFALGGDPLFGQIVKSGEPVLSALVNTVFYGTPPSNAKIGCLPIIVGGVAFASLKKDVITGGYALKFDQTALVFGMMANTFAAFKGSENKKLMSDKNTAERFAGVGNQVSRVESS
jgi:solute carrier family 35 protein E1